MLKRYLFFIVMLLGFVLSGNLYAQTTEEKLALQYFQDQEYQKAAELYKQLHTAQPSAFFYNSYLDCLVALRNYDEAHEFVKKVKKQNQNQLKYDIDLAYLYQLQGETKKADKLNRRVLKKSGASRESLLDLVNAYHDRGMEKEAIACLEKGKRLFDDPPMNIEMAQLYMQLGRYEEMISEYLELVEVGDKYIRVVQDKLQLYIKNDDSPAMHMAIKNALLKKIQEQPGETIYSELLYWYSIQKKDFKIALIQSKSLDRKFREGGERVYALANTLITNKEFALAEDALKHVLSYGEKSRFYQAASLRILDVRFKKIESGTTTPIAEVEQLAKDYVEVLGKYGKGPTTSRMMSNLASLYAFYLHEEDKATDLLKSLTQMARLDPKEKAEAKMLLGDVLLFKGQKWEANLLYKQVEKAFKHEPIGAEAKFKSARFFYYVGEMEWAKMQLDVLKASTTKLIANDAMDLALLIQENMDPDSTYSSLSRYAKAELLIYQKKYTHALSLLDTILNIFPNYEILDEALYQKANIYHQLGKLSTADSLYTEVYNYDRYGILADNALFRSAELNDKHFNNKEKAKELYEIIVMNYPGSIYLQEARKRFREMSEAPSTPSGPTP